MPVTDWLMAGKKAVEHDQGQADYDEAGGPGDDIPEAGVFVLAHEVGAVDQDQHEDGDDGQQYSVEDLRQDGYVDELSVGEGEYGDGSAGDEQGVEPVEEGCFFEVFVDA